MSHHHDSTDRLPIGAGLVLIAWATCQFTFNLHLHSSLLSAAVYHNLIDGVLLLSGRAIERWVARPTHSHMGRNKKPLTGIAVYGFVVILVALSVIGHPKPHVSRGFVLIEGLDAFVNAGVYLWLRRSTRSDVGRGAGFHFLIDAVIAPTLVMASFLAAGGPYEAGSWVVVAAVAVAIGHEAYDLVPSLHLHRQANCHDREEP